ncbi:hypothetical protein BsWGS_22160 [Bradybaena similaris]
MEDIKADPRFAHILSDPKFRVIPKSRKKVKIDSRFRSVFNSEHFSHQTDIDKRGRPVFDVSKRSQHVMKRFYQLSDDDDDVNSDRDQDQEVPKKQQNDKTRQHKRVREDNDHNSYYYSRLPSQGHNNPQEYLPESKKKATKAKPHKAHAANRPDSSLPESSLSAKDVKSPDQLDQEDSSKGTTDDDEDLPEFSQEYALEETDIDHRWNELHTDASPVSESTCRLAVCNMDWDFVRAQDLFVLFKSFVPDGGHVRSVTIFPSEFGKERMAEEARLGPREIREHKSQECIKADREEQNSKKKRATNQQHMKRVSKDLQASQTERRREYQLNRLRYYFAVVDCDSAVTAETIYAECDGREYLLSSVQLDLRFIPDDMTFDDPPKEMFSQEQSILEYEPNRFSSTALCQAKVDVTWDETEFDRLSRRIGSMQHKELESIVEDNKYADIIAPPESDSDEGMDDQPDWLKLAIDGNGDIALSEEEKIAMYRKLLMEKLDNEESGDEGDVKEKEGEKELVWTPGLKSSLLKRMEKKERNRENTGVINDYLEKKREKKKKKKEDKVKKRTVSEKVQADLVKNNMSQQVDAESTYSQSKRKKKKQKMHKIEDKTEANNMADLELLVMADGDQVQDVHTDKDGPSSKKGKKKKKKKLVEVKNEFQLDMNDARFAALYTSQHFHIDPSCSQFKKSTNMAALMNEQIKRRGHLGKCESVTVNRSGQSAEHVTSLSHALVESIKSKLKK